MAIKAIVFDCDGIILESVDAKTQAFAQVAAQFGAEAKDRLSVYHKIHGGVSRQDKFRWLYEEVLEQELSEAELSRLCHEFSKWAYDNVVNAPLVPGIMQVLTEWSAKLPLFVCSGTPQDELVEVLTKRDLAKFFQGIYGTPPAKTELLRRIVAGLPFMPEEVLMVGDSITDEDAALAVGTLFYGRGEQFAKYPWDNDLQKLSGWLAANA